MRRIRALVALRLRRLWRTRALLLAATLTLLPVAAASPATSRAALAILASGLLTAVLVCTAGAIADDLDDGAALLLVLHGAGAAERVLAESLATLLATLFLALLALAAMSDAISTVGSRTVLLAGCWIAALLLGWTFLIVLLGCALPGKGNALVMILPLAAFAIPAHALPLGDAAPWIASVVRAAWNLLPLQAHLTAVVESLLADGPLPHLPASVLLASPPFYLVAAVRALSRVEPARRFTR